MPSASKPRSPPRFQPKYRPQSQKLKRQLPVTAQPGDDPRVSEKIDEIRFYLAHGMPEQAMAGLAKLQTLTTDKARVDEVRAEVEAAAMEAAEAQAPSRARTGI